MIFAISFVTFYSNNSCQIYGVDFMANDNAQWKIGRRPSFPLEQFVRLL